MGHGNAALRAAIALQVLVCLTGWSGELSASASGPSLPRSCIDTPTARCAIDLTIVTAEELGDSDADARAYALALDAARQTLARADLNRNAKYFWDLYETGPLRDRTDAGRAG